jgi:pimeloyl-ACP methyl ester carboxylesterase
MSTLAFTRLGAGDPLVLLHALGLSRQSWDPVLAAVSEQFDVLAVDLPGFGDSPPLDRAIEPEPAALAGAVAELLDELGIDAPHVAGNSLGGWVALELAGLRPVSSLVLLSPAGMWRKETPLYCWVSLRLTRLLAVHAGSVLRRLVRSRAGRALVLGQAVGHPTRMTPAAALAAVDAMASSRGFDATLQATRRRRFRAGPPFDAPVTVAFGSRDRILLRRAWRRRDELPAATRLEFLPGCGHVPMSDDPAAVAALLTAAGRGGRAHRAESAATAR